MQQGSKKLVGNILSFLERERDRTVTLFNNSFHSVTPFQLDRFIPFTVSDRSPFLTVPDLPERFMSVFDRLMTFFCVYERILPFIFIYYSNTRRTSLNGSQMIENAQKRS
jgi:hypothetical protein